MQRCGLEVAVHTWEIWYLCYGFVLPHTCRRVPTSLLAVNVSVAELRQLRGSCSATFRKPTLWSECSPRGSSWATTAHINTQSTATTQHEPQQPPILCCEGLASFFFSAWPTLREIKFAATVNLTARVPRGIITTYTFQTPWVLPCGFANTVDG